MALDPDYISVVKDDSGGVGFETFDMVSCEAPRQAITDCVAYCHRCQAVPLEANNAQGFFVDKKNGKHGLAGLRPTHRLCRFWSHYFAGAPLYSERTPDIVW